MGLNISGIVIDKNYENNLTEIESIVGQKLVFEKEVTFEETLESWKEETYCDVYFSKNGTFVVLSMEIGGFDFYVKNQIAFSFVLSEMTTMSIVHYTKNDKLLRYIIESDEMNEDEGEPFEFEKNEEDKSKLIYHLIEKTLGESFYSIGLESKCFRYSFKKESINPSGKDNINLLSNEKKTWWRFW